jgi:hypothetical protein
LTDWPADDGLLALDGSWNVLLHEEGPGILSCGRLALLPSAASLTRLRYGANQSSALAGFLVAPPEADVDEMSHTREMRIEVSRQHELS